MVCPEPFITGAVKAGGRVVPDHARSARPAYLLSGYMASRDWIAKNAALARRFADTVRATGDWANANPALAAPLLSKFTNIPQPVIGAAAHYGTIPQAFPASEIIANLR